MTVNKPPPKKGPGSPASGQPAGQSMVKPGENSERGLRQASQSSGSAASVKGGMTLAQARAEALLRTEGGVTKEKFAKPQDRIEDKVLAISALNIPEPQMFRDFIERVAPKLMLEKTSCSLLDAFASIDVTAERVGAVIRSNPYYEHQFYKMLESLGRRDAVPSIDGAVVMLGMQNSRNLIIALQLTRMVRGTHPEWTKDGKLKTSPVEIVKYALRAEDFVSSYKGEYADIAFGAGLVFDLLVLLADRMSDDKKKVIGYIDAIFNHGLRTAQIATSIAKSMPDFASNKYLFSTCLIHDVGKVIMAILDSHYFEFLDLCVKRELPRAIRHFAEEKRFGMNHAMLGGMLCHYFRIFRPVKKAVFHHHDPYLLHFRNRDLYQLASLVCLATNVANNFKNIEKSDDPVVSTWKGMELDGFSIEMDVLLNAISRVT